MPPRAWDQGTQQQTRLTEVYTERPRETLGQGPDSGLTARLTAATCCLQHQKQLWLVHRSVAAQREVENIPLPPLGAASPGLLMLRSAAPNIWISPSPDREKVQLRCVPLCPTTAARTLRDRLPTHVGDVSFSTRYHSFFPRLTTRLKLPIFSSTNTCQHNSLTRQHQLSQLSPSPFLFYAVSQHPALALLPNFPRAGLTSSLSGLTQLLKSAPRFVLSEPEPSPLQLPDNYSVISFHFPPEGIAFFRAPRSLSPATLTQLRQAHFKTHYTS